MEVAASSVTPVGAPSANRSGGAPSWDGRGVLITTEAVHRQRLRAGYLTGLVLFYGARLPPHCLKNDRF